MATRQQMIAFLQDVIQTYQTTQNSPAYSASKKQTIQQKLGFLQAFLNGLNSAAQMSDERVEQIRRLAAQYVDDITALEYVRPRERMNGTPMQLLSNQGDIRPRQQGHELRLVNGRYRVVNLATDVTTVADGGYVFVIPAATPWRILVGQRANGGHTAISRGSDVYYAGEIDFDNGILQRWTNSSGHYVPNANLRAQVPPLLPANRFEYHNG